MRPTQSNSQSPCSAQPFLLGRLWLKETRFNILSHSILKTTSWKFHNAGLIIENDISVCSGDPSWFPEKWANTSRRWSNILSWNARPSSVPSFLTWCLVKVWSNKKQHSLVVLYFISLLVGFTMWWDTGWGEKSIETCIAVIWPNSGGTLFCHLCFYCWSCRWPGLKSVCQLWVMRIPRAWTWAGARTCAKRGCMDAEGRAKWRSWHRAPVHTVITTLSGSTRAMCWAQMSRIRRRHSPEGSQLKLRH